MTRALSFKLSFDVPSMTSVDVRSTRLPFAGRVSDAPPLNFRLASVALAKRSVDLPVMVTRSLATGTPLGLQFAAVDQLPPVAGPTQILLPGVKRNARCGDCPLKSKAPVRTSG